VVRRGRAVGVEAEHDAGEVGVVGGGAAADGAVVLVGLAGAVGAVDEVLHPAAAAVVADDHVQLAGGGGLGEAGVVVAGHLGGVAAVAVVLEGVQADDVLVEGQGGGGGVPDEAVHAVAQQRHVADVAGDGAGAALGPVQVDVVVVGDVRAQG